VSHEANGYLLELHEWLSMNYRNLKTQEVEGIIWGLIVAIMLTGFGLPPAFALIVGIIFAVVAVFVLDNKRCLV
jgi:hypothetical protein